jgi:TPR repeat protein
MNPVYACDLLAAPPGDTETQAPGVRFQDIDAGRALPICESLAKQPQSPRALYIYGRVLDAAKRYAEAAEQYSAADRAGYPRAAAALGGLYYMGLGVPKDAVKAIGLYRRAGDSGYAEAYAILGTIYLEQQPPNFRQAIAAYDRATRAGSPLGQVGLGEMYGGGVGVTKNQTRAVSLFRQAADKGEPLGMFDLGVSYLIGAGVQKNTETGFLWLLRAAELGIPPAQNAVAHMYETGEGVAENRGEAIAWYRKIAEQGDPTAQANLARLSGPAAVSNLPPAPSTDTSSGGFGDLIGPGGFIAPLPGSAPPPASGAQPREPISPPSNNVPDPPYRPLPTQRVDSGLSDEAAILVGVGIAASVWWLLSGSSGSSSGGGVIDSGSSSPDFGGFGGGGGGSPPSERPVSSPMNGDITRTLHGEDALYGQVNRR